ncbi:MAG: hypothetical protein KDI48_19400, partial [Xanthomonadales bacterium]|nr:hypothetical protein [Xanthomonadales bacterium]
MDFRKTLNGLLLLAALGLPATGVRAAWEGDWSVPRGCNQPITQLERLDANRAILLGSFDVCGTAAAPGMAVYDFSGNRFRAVGVGLSATVDVLPDLRALAARSDGAGKVYLAGIDADSRLRLARVGSSNGLEWIVSSGGPELAGEPVAMDFDSAGQLYLATEQGVLRGSPGSPWSWTRLGALDLFPSTGQLLALAYDRERSQVVVGGNFQSIGGTAASHIAHWNGSSWQPLTAPLDGIGLDGPVNTLVSLPDGNAGLSSGLYVGGQFTGGVAGVLELHNITRYNGFGYNALGASLSTRGLRNG